MKNPESRVYLRLVALSQAFIAHTMAFPRAFVAIVTIRIDGAHITPVERLIASCSGCTGITWRHARSIGAGLDTVAKEVIATLIICSARVTPVEGFIANCSGYTGITWRHAISIDAGLDSVAKTLIATIIICSARATQSLLFIAH
jgi:hypothetical protein